MSTPKWAEASPSGTVTITATGNEEGAIECVALKPGSTYDSADSAANAFSLNKWTHVAVTRTAAGVSNVYINGALSSTADQQWHSGRRLRPSHRQQQRRHRNLRR